MAHCRGKQAMATFQNPPAQCRHQCIQKGRVLLTMRCPSVHEHHPIMIDAKNHPHHNRFEEKDRKHFTYPMAVPIERAQNILRRAQKMQQQ
jgi:hypothetical protein